MKKETPNLTTNEKIEFGAKLNTLNANTKRKIDNPATINNFIYKLGLKTILCNIFIFFSLLTTNMPFVIFGWSLFATSIVTSIITHITQKKAENNIISNLSNGKITAKQYFKLVKSGKIEKFQQQFKEQIEIKVNQIKGIKIEEYKRTEDKTIVNAVYESLPNKNDRNKIPDLIEENNKTI